MVKKGQRTGPAREHPARCVESESCPSPAPTSSSPGCPAGAQPRERATPGAHLHVVTLLLLHLRVDTQLLPGTQHTYPGPGRRESRGVQEPAPSAIRQQEHALRGAQRETELTHKREWLGPERTPGLGGTLSAASPRVSKETRQGKRGRRRRLHPLCAPPPRRLGQDARTPAAVQGSDRGRAAPFTCLPR